MSAIRKLSEVLSEVLSEKDIAKLKPIIDYLEAHAGISPQTAKSLINESEATVTRYLKILVESGLVVQQGKRIMSYM